MLPDEIRVFRTCGDPHAVLNLLLESITGRAPEFGNGPNGKPYLTNSPSVKFNLSKSKGKALIAVALDVEVGIDIEAIAPMPDLAAIAERYMPPGDAEALAATPEPAREREFFRRWTRAEALWKAAGLGLYGAGAIPDGEWMIEDIDGGEGFAAAVAAAHPGLTVRIFDFGADQ